MAVIYKNCYEKLLEFGITDVNFHKNYCFLIDLFLRKKFIENINLLENIILYEIDTKAEISEDKIFFTLGPNKIFKNMFHLIEILKDMDLFMLLEEFLSFISKIIIQYLSAIDFIIRVIF